jgi:hypothetical protein
MNLPTTLIALLVAGVVLAIVIHEIHNRKQGKPSCSCGCSGCSMSDICHNKKEQP